MADLIEFVHGFQQGAQPRRGGEQDGEQAGQEQRGGLALGDARDIGEILQDDGQALPGQQRVQGGEHRLRVQLQQADEEVDAHKQGKEGQDQKIGQGGGGPGHPQTAVGLDHIPDKEHRGQLEKRSVHGGDLLSGWWDQDQG